MKVTFIIASVGKQKNGHYVSSWIMEPLGIAVLSALTPKSIDRVFYDDRIEDIPFDEETDMVAINMETYSAARAYQISEEYRKRNVKVVLGGFHATLMPEEAANYADAILVGEAEEVWKELLDDFEAGTLKKFYKQNKHCEIKDITPDRSIFYDKAYPKVSLVETGRGCTFGCEFCSVAEFFENRYKVRPINSIVKEIREASSKLIFFVDDNIGVNREHTIQLFKALIPLKIKWMGQVSMHISDDEELLDLMEKSGCQGVLIGFESLNPSILEKMGKNVNQTIKSYEFVIRQLYKYNIAIYATFVLGYDDTEKSFEEIYDFGIRNRLFYVAFNHLVPFPGTKLYTRLRNEGRLIYDKWWMEPRYRFGDVVFNPSNMTANELTDLCLKYRYKFFKARSNYKRLLNKVHWTSLQKIYAYMLLNLSGIQQTEARRKLLIGGEV